jgi:hypothetical protein
MPTKPNTKNKDKPNIGSPLMSSQNPILESSGARTTQSASEMVPRTAAHVLGAPPVVHNPPTARTASTSHRAQVAGAANVEGNRSRSTTPKDKSVTIPTAASDPAPKPSPHGLTKMFSMVAKGPIVPGNGWWSPRSSVPPCNISMETLSCSYPTLRLTLNSVIFESYVSVVVKD